MAAVYPSTRRHRALSSACRENRSNRIIRSTRPFAGGWLAAAVALATTVTAAQTQEYFPPPESQGGWRTLTKPDDVRKKAGMDPAKLAELKDWLDRSDKRRFAAVVIRHGYIALEVERGRSAKTDAQRVLDWAAAEDAVGIVVGLPLSMDGTESAQTKLTKAFAAHVRAIGQLPVELVDERLTTFQADETLRAADLRASKRRPMRDAVAAQIILQSFLDARRSENPPR